MLSCEDTCFCHFPMVLLKTGCVDFLQGVYCSRSCMSSFVVLAGQRRESRVHRAVAALLREASVRERITYTGVEFLSYLSIERSYVIEPSQSGVDHVDLGLEFLCMSTLSIGSLDQSKARACRPQCRAAGRRGPGSVMVRVRDGLM